MQRIVIHSGRIHAAMRFHIDASSGAEEAKRSQFDTRTTIGARASGGFGLWSASASVDTTIGYVEANDRQSREQLNASADLNSSVEIHFRTDQVPLDRIASSQTVNRRRQHRLIRPALDRRQTSWDAFPYTSGGKMGAETVGLATAQAHPKVALRADTRGTRLVVDGSGRISAVEVETADARQILSASIVILAGGAGHTAALLQTSGLANSSAQVERSFINPNIIAGLAIPKTHKGLRKAGYLIMLSRAFDRCITFHQCGTARMGADPVTSVVIGFCRSHDHSNLFVVDALVLPTSGAVNPALTIAAPALRTANHIKPTDWA